MRQVVNLTRQANLNVKSLKMVMKAQINSILTIHLILSSLDLAIDFHTQQVLQLLKHQHKHTTLYLYMVALVLVRHILCMRSVIMFLAINQMLKYYILQVKNSQMTSSNQFVTMNLKPLEKV